MTSNSWKCNVPSVGICDLTKNSFRSEAEIIDTQSRVKVSEIRAAAWCGAAGVHLVLSNLARERRQERRVCGGVGFCFLRVEAPPCSH